MPSDKEYLLFIQDQLSNFDSISYRAMMGEYIIYYKGKVVGGIYDDRLLLKSTPSAISLIESPIFTIPYPGAKEMLEIENVDDRELLFKLIKAVFNDLFQN